VSELRLEVWSWLDGLKNWQLDLVRQLLHTPALDEKHQNEAIDMLLAVGGLKIDGARTPEPISKDQFLGVKDDQQEAPSILRLYELENVSAVQKGQALEFAETGLTIVFGNNAAGKSSYARVLKQSCRTVDEKVKILPNIYESQNGQQTTGIAKIDIAYGGASETITRTVNTPPEPKLRTISIFDSRCGSLYLTTENDVAYVPHDLVILQRLAVNQDRLKAVLQERAKTLKSQLPNFAEFVEDTSIKQKLRDLSAQSKPEEFTKLSVLSEEENENFVKLEKELIELKQADPTKSIAQTKRRITECAEFISKVKLALAKVSDEKAQQINQLLQKLKMAQEAYELARGKHFGSELVAGVGSDSWKTLWLAAREYFCQEAYPESTFPPDSEKHERCPFCHQEISDEASRRLKRFEEFVSDKTESHLRDAQSAVEKAKGEVTGASITAVETHSICVYLKEDADDVWKIIETFCAEWKKRRDDLEALCGDSSKSVAAMTTSPLPKVEKWLEGLNAFVAEKELLLQPGRKEQLEKQVAEFKARQLLAKRIGDVLAAISKHKEISVMEASVRALSTTSMTTKISDFVEKAVTAELNKCLEHELKALNCNDIPIKVGSRGEKGKTKCHIALKSVDQAALSEILSQGEQRALALAFFLAEVGSSRNNGPIILDDPVSSLDHLRRKYVAERLVEESKNRQVIVFTHDIVFLLDLQSAVKKLDAQSTAISVRKVGKTSGIASKDLPWIAQTCKERKGYLKNDLQRLEKLERTGSDPDRLERDMKSWYELLREAWERAIEERLFGGVVERFRYGIETQRLKNVNVTEEKLKLVNEGMTSTSARCHDESSAVNRGCATVAEADADLKKYEEFLSKCPVS